jgi:hypothetical protein
MYKKGDLLQVKQGCESSVNIQLGIVESATEEELTIRVLKSKFRASYVWDRYTEPIHILERHYESVGKVDFEKFKILYS